MRTHSKNKWIIDALMILAMAFTGCAHGDDAPLSPSVPALKPIFSSSFEGNVAVSAHNANAATFAGADDTVEAPNDFGLLNPPYLTSFKIQYLGGELSQRRATIQKDPTDPGNSVLSFRVKEANMGNRARIQTHTSTATGFSEIRYRFRMWLGEGWKTLRDLPRRSDWFIFNEFWNNAGWAGEDHPFRIHMTLSNLYPQDESGIYCVLSSQTAPIEGKREWNWKIQNPQVKLPIGEWIDCELYIKQGNETDGRFVFTIRTDDNGLQTVFDVNGFTHHPKDPAPDGFQHFHPLKMYMARGTVEDAVAGEGALGILYDDFALYGRPVE